MTNAAGQISKKRKELGYSMKEVSTLLGIPYRTWQDWESGQRPCPSYTEKLIIYYLDHEVEALT